MVIGGLGIMVITGNDDGNRWESTGEQQQSEVAARGKVVVTQIANLICGGCDQAEKSVMLMNNNFYLI